MLVHCHTAGEGVGIRTGRVSGRAGEQLESWGETARADVHLDSKSRVLQAPPIPGETQASKWEAPVLVTWEERGVEGGSSLICIMTLLPPISWALSTGTPGTGP